jgi:glycosyltransferase involved in cell wall biosynthesis
VSNRQTDPIHVLHVVTGLETGGAETMLERLVMASDRTMFRHSIVSLTTTTMGPIGSRLQEAGVTVQSLGMKRGSPSPRALFRLLRMIRAQRPDIIKSWLYHADLAAALAVIIVRIPLIWGVHYTAVSSGGMKPLTLWTAHMCAFLSKFVPRAIVTDSHAAVEVHRKLGYPKEKFVVIPNGFDTQRWHPDESARRSVRDELGISDDTILIGNVARFHPAKDHRTFLEAASYILRDAPDVRFVLCGGTGIDQDNALLTGWIKELGLTKAVLLLGNRPDLPRIVAALDIGVSSSRTESFPLAIGEMMASAIPCVVTDVGDSAYLVGQSGRVVPAVDPQALASACLQLMAEGPAERRRLGLRSRERVLEEFSIASTVARYQSVFFQSAGSLRT